MTIFITSNLSLFICILFLLLSFSSGDIITSSNTATTAKIGGGINKTKVIYDIPLKFSAFDDLITDFKAVSSHGRTDNADLSIAITYTKFQVFLRAVYLCIVFSPMLFTSGFAYISSWYRNVIWFGLLRFGISQGGAVSNN